MRIGLFWKLKQSSLVPSGYGRIGHRVLRLVKTYILLFNGFKNTKKTEFPFSFQDKKKRCSKWSKNLDHCKSLSTARAYQQHESENNCQTVQVLPMCAKSHNCLGTGMIHEV